MAERYGERQLWSLCISGDVDRLFVVSVDKESTVAQLKSIIEQRLSAPVDQQTLYFQEQVLHNDSVLNSISGLHHGGVVFLSDSRRRYFSLTICSWLSGSPEEVQLKLSYNIMNQPLSALKKTICQRFGVKEPMLICEEEIVDASYDDTLLCDSVITDGAVVVLQKMPVTVSLTDQDTSFSFFVPQRTTIGFLKQQLSDRTGANLSQIESGVFFVKGLLHFSNKCDYFAKTAASHQISEPFDIERKGWGLDVQRLDGTKLTLQVECCENTPIVKLRELVEEYTGVPTHQQRLTIGSTIVEDWDDEDRMMFIGDYPNIHDGSLLYLVQLEGGSRLKVEFSGTDVVKLSRRHSEGVNKYCYQTCHFYVNHIKSFGDLVAKMPKESMKIKDKDGSDMGESIGPDYVVFIEYKRSYYSPPQITWY